MLLAEGVKRAFASRVGRRDEFREVGAGELTVVIEGVLEDVDDGLLEGDDLRLELVFREGCGRSALPFHLLIIAKRTVPHGKSSP